MPYLINWPFGGFQLWVKTDWWYNEMDSRMWPPASRYEVDEYHNAEEYLKQAVGTWRNADKDAFIEQYLALVSDTTNDGLIIPAMDTDEGWPNGPNWEDISMRGMHHPLRDPRFDEVWNALDGLSTSPTAWWEEHGDHYDTQNTRTNRGNLMQLACMEQYITDDFGPLMQGGLTDNFRVLVHPYLNTFGENSTAFDVMQSVVTLDNIEDVEMDHGRLQRDTSFQMTKPYSITWSSTPGLKKAW